MTTDSLLRSGCVCSALLLSAMALAGCKSTRDAIINQSMDKPDVKQKVIASGQKSCVDAWQKKLPNQSAALDHTMHTFCDCIAEKTTETYSSAELLELGLRGEGSKTPEQKAKSASNIKACEMQAGIPAS